MKRYFFIIPLIIGAYFLFTAKFNNHFVENPNVAHIGPIKNQNKNSFNKTELIEKTIALHDLQLKSKKEITKSQKPSKQMVNLAKSSGKKPKKSIKRKALFAAQNTKDGQIGSNDTINDTPNDNLFYLNINHRIANASSAWLEYELFGVADYTSVCKGVNDNLSFGGLILKQNNEWTTQKEQINLSDIKDGWNIVRFSSPDQSNIAYKVRNVKIRFENKAKQNQRQLVINQPSTAYYYQRYGYITGFITGKGSEKARIYANNKELRTSQATFEGLVSKEKSDSSVWSSEVKAVFEDGTELSVTVVFTHPDIYDYVTLKNNSFQYATKSFTPKDSINLELNSFALRGQAGSLSRTTKLSVHTLRTQDMPVMGPAMKNVSGQSKGYRLLPHHSQFKNMLKIAVPYDSLAIPKGYRPSDIRTYFYDEEFG